MFSESLISLVYLLSDSNEAGQSRPLPVLPEGKLVDAKLGAAGDAALPLNSSTLLPGIETWQSGQKQYSFR